MINPRDLIRTLSVESLNETADQYYKALSDPNPLLAKPFSSLVEAPDLLQNMGLLLSGLHLGKTMTVLEFAAGPCWFSRFLYQLQCQTISCDVSQTALDWGKRFFEDHPVMGAPVGKPRFLRFDGHRLDLPDESVDRIVCNDGFHHVPNQEEVIRELGRVLKTGGIAAFSEPGRFHSQSPQSQSEMRHFQVLENDIILEEIFGLAKKHGFTELKVKVAGNLDVSLREYQSLIGKWPGLLAQRKVMKSLRKVLSNKTIFFLHKGKFLPDSRLHEGLSHQIDSPCRGVREKRGKAIRLSMKIQNTGEGRWLTKNIAQIGVVHIGTHLYDGENRPVSFEFSRHPLPGQVEPGTQFTTEIPIKIDSPGTYKLAVDLVSEGVSWFEFLGSKPWECSLEIQ